MHTRLYRPFAGLVLGAAALALLPAAPAAAIDVMGTTVAVPVVMHGPGKLSTQWRTDVWIGNHNSVPKTVTLDLYPTTGGVQSSSVDVGAFAVVKLPDIVLTTFGLDDAKGLLIASVSGSSAFEVHARVYNTGSAAGEFGQFEPGIAVDRLQSQGYLFGLSAVDGNRTNLGLANPNDVASDVHIQISDGGNTASASLDVPMTPHSLVQINDIFATMGFPPQANAQIVVTAPSNDTPIYAYASVVRDDTGDAIFLFGTSPNG